MKPIYICTGPSKFTPEVIHMIEDFFKGKPDYLLGCDEENIKDSVSKASALILAGGNDVHYMTYGQSYPAGCHMKNFDLKRDKKEIKLIKMCIAQQIPILGLCRGFQLLCITRKDLNLIADISDD